MIAAVLALSLTAHAQEKGPMEVGVRGRWLTLPDSFLNAWVYPESAGFQRPHIGGWAAGAEYNLHTPGARWTFYGELYRFTMQAGYWDDVEDDDLHDDGNWLDPDTALGMVAIGANVGQEIPITSDESNVWLGFDISGGLGIGLRTGNITKWYGGSNLIEDPVVDETCLPDSSAYDRKDSCDPDGFIKVPPVLPLLDFNLGLKIHMGEHAWLRLEGGLHDLFYAGGAAGGRF